MMIIINLIFKKMKKWMWVIAIVLVIIVLAVIFDDKEKDNSTIKIGVVTDLTGPAAYWGESTRVGADILKKELVAQGKNIDFIFEDYALDPSKAISGAQKLVNVDKVNTLYIEFNPGVIATASFLKDKEIPYIYDAAITSPLKENILAYKTYLDNQVGCKQIAQKFKDEGVTKIGMLKMNLEAAELCENGVKEVYGDNVISEGYNPGTTDFRTQILKISNAGAGAVINMAFEGDSLNTLKVIKDYGYKLRYGTVDDSITQSVLDSYKNELKGAWTFGFNAPSSDFQSKIKDYKLATPYAAALAYTHLKQLTGAIDKCGTDNKCIVKFLDQSPADPTIGFQGYKNHIADLIMAIKEY
jgi:ABC-type branched-subunit amino acid transport system substrate-binding protein